MSNLAGKTIIITGASRGIGRSIALRCAADGANVVVAAKSVEEGGKLKGTIHSVAAEVEAAGGKALALQVDVREPDQIQRMVEQTVERFGGVDGLVNNAGAIMLLPTEQLPQKRFDLIHDINVRAVYLAAQACIPYLKKSASPHIVSLSPPIGMEARWFENHTPYTVSKFAMTMMTFGLAAELRSAGVAATTLWPRTLIATAAVEWIGGDVLMKASRTPEIMADAVHAILTSPLEEVTGRSFIDEDLLRSRGVTEFEHYRVDPSTPLMTDLFVPDA